MAKPIIVKRKRGSVNAAMVAHEVISRVEKGRKISVSAIMREKGYSPETAKAPSKVTLQAGYKAVIDPYVEKMQKTREKYVQELFSSKRKLSKSNSLVLSTVIKNLTHDIQLLTGGKTEDNGIGEYATALEDLRLAIMKKK